MKKNSIFGLISIAIAIAVIIAVMSKSSTYGTFSEAKKTTSELEVVGLLDKQKELYYDAAKDANYFSFYVRDNDKKELFLPAQNLRILKNLKKLFLPAK